MTELRNAWQRMRNLNAKVQLSEWRGADTRQRQETANFKDRSECKFQPPGDGWRRHSESFVSGPAALGKLGGNERALSRLGDVSESPIEHSSRFSTRIPVHFRLPAPESPDSARLSSVLETRCYSFYTGTYGIQSLIRLQSPPRCVNKNPPVAAVS